MQRYRKGWFNMIADIHGEYYQVNDVIELENINTQLQSHLNQVSEQLHELNTLNESLQTQIDDITTDYTNQVIELNDAIKQISEQANASSSKIDYILLGILAVDIAVRIYLHA